MSVSCAQGLYPRETGSRIGLEVLEVEECREEGRCAHEAYSRGTGHTCTRSRLLCFGRATQEPMGEKCGNGKGVSHLFIGSVCTKEWGGKIEAAHEFGRVPRAR